MSSFHSSMEGKPAAGSSDSGMSTTAKDPGALGSNVISIALICPEERCRQPIAAALSELRGSATREFSSYPELDDLPRLLETSYDVIIVELDSNPEYALDVVETICANSSATVMVYSMHVYPEMLVRCMRAGAREFLTSPISSGAIAEALVRASVRRPVSSPAKKTAGRMMVFVGAKGGSGVTTIACNFAVALAQESKQSTLLVDLNLPLGDVALELGIRNGYSTAHALHEYQRLDFNFLSSLLSKHSSGLSVLAAPDKYTEVVPTSEAVQRLLAIARQNFDYVIVDAGSRFGPAGKALFEDCSTIYLVTQVSIADLRNSNRLISELFKGGSANVEVILNRFASRSLTIDEESITKALTLRPQWKVPSDFAVARSAQNSATPLVLTDSSISRVIWQMVRAAHGAPTTQEKKKRFGLFG